MYTPVSLLWLVRLNAEALLASRRDRYVIKAKALVRR